ncbi:MAG: hypothetical protein HFF50_04790 [Lawsonibacter sp.]|nr:hypothetical protein [Lawsonibacter sp.]
MKRFLKIFLLGVCLGILATAIRYRFHMSQSTFWTYFGLAAALAVVSAVLFNWLYTRVYQQKMAQAVKLLEEGKTSDYILTMERLLEKVKGTYLKNLFQLNLAAGYCNAKQFHQATRLLEELSGARLPGVARMVYHLNLCACYFYTGQPARAMELYESCQKEFAPFREGPSYGGNLAVLDMFAAIQRRQYSQAKELLGRARETWNLPRLQDDYNCIEAELVRRKKM